MSRTRFVNASVIDGSGDDPFLATVAVVGDRIHAVTPQAAPEPVAEAPSAGDAVVDCTGLTVMPGLTEAHCHISFNDIVTMETVVAIQPEDHSLIALKNAQMLMARGFTSLFSAAAAKPRLDVAVRNAIDSGMFPGPRIRAASQEISPSGNLGDLNTSYLELPRSIAFSVSCDGEEEFTKAARLGARDGVDNLKINVSGDRDWGHMHADAETTVINEAEIAAVVSVAGPRNLMVGAHSTSSEGVKMCVRQGVQVVNHAVYADEEARDMLEQVKDRVFVVPALGLPITMLRESGDFGLGWPTEKYENLEKELEVTRHCMRDLNQRGVRVLPGGDYGAFITNPIGTNARDLEHFVDFLGFSPMETLVAATRLGGELMQRGDELGQIKPGYLADLMVIDGDPIADIALLQDPDRIRAVMVAGRFAKSRLPEAAAATAAPEVLAFAE